jgi:hypothetical protein
MLAVLKIMVVEITSTSDVPSRIGGDGVEEEVSLSARTTPVPTVTVKGGSMAKRQSREKKAATVAEIRLAVAQLEEYHRLGARLLKQYPPGRKHDKEAQRLEAAEAGMEPIKVFQIRNFADPKKGYSSEELKTLTDLCWQHKCALGFTFVLKFLTIRDKKKRAKFQRDAIKGHWGLHTVDQKRGNFQSRRPRVGRKPAVPDTLDDLYAALQSRALYWGRLKTELQKKPAPNSSRLRWSEVPKTIRDVLDDAVAAMEKLEAALGDHLPSPENEKPA